MSLPPEYEFRRKKPYNDDDGWSINEWLLVALLMFLIWWWIC